MLFAFPGLLLAILVVGVFGAGLIAPVLALSIAYTAVHRPRSLRGAALRERQPCLHRGAARCRGSPALAICLRHLLPNVRPLIVAQATVVFGYAMVDLAALSFLGLGVQPPTADWGVMVVERPGRAAAAATRSESLSRGRVRSCSPSSPFNVLGDRLGDRAGRARDR